MANLKHLGVGQQYLAQVLSHNGVKVKPYMKHHRTEKSVSNKITTSKNNK